MTISFFFCLDACSLFFLITILNLLQSDPFFASRFFYLICCNDKPRTISRNQKKKLLQERLPSHQNQNSEHQITKQLSSSSPRLTKSATLLAHSQPSNHSVSFAVVQLSTPQLQFSPTNNKPTRSLFDNPTLTSLTSLTSQFARSQQCSSINYSASLGVSSIQLAFKTQ
ncbi:MAG: hypothetical protein JOS17DRAFT_388355 [Linnemannia elongata]|nr:MAG: hypothetical protein JOS17DRAFT_388355 [Linnemannia elongata]